MAEYHKAVTAFPLDPEGRWSTEEVSFKALAALESLGEVDPNTLDVKIEEDLALDFGDGLSRKVPLCATAIAMVLPNEKELEKLNGRP